MIRRDELGSLKYDLEPPKRGGAGFLRAQERWESRTLFLLAEALYEFEVWSKASPEYSLLISSEVAIKHADLAARIGKILERLVSYVLLLDARVALVPTAENLYDSGSSLEVAKKDAVCLFSGGVDSLAGALVTLQRNPDLIGVFCAHSNQSRIVSLVRSIAAAELQPRGIELVEMPAPTMRPTGYSQLRGFFYIMAAAAVAVSRGARHIIVSECGPTMYQPRFSPIDQVTMTTHPFVVDRVRDILHALTSYGLVIETPFEDMTKAEVMAVCPDKKALASTHSCISQRLRTQDGTCFGCVVRRLAALAAGVPDSIYARDPITQSSANPSNLLALLEFSSGILLIEEDMPWYQRELIEVYGKWDLFRRYALDNFAALYRLETAGTKLTDAVAGIYSRVLSVVGSSALGERLDVLKRLSQNQTTSPSEVVGERA